MNELVKFEKVNEKSVPATTSKVIAEVFKKNHFHVIRDIENYIESGEFTESNFGCSSYKDDSGKSNTMYILDESE
jgi:Rha family phage regulatory protein